MKLLAVNNELAQLLATETDGAGGNAMGAAVPLPAILVQPFAVCVTVNVPADETVMELVVAPVLHNTVPTILPAVKTLLPQLLLTVTVGADGTGIGDAIPDPNKLAHPATVWLTV